jgi:hypothetical protein
MPASNKLSVRAYQTSDRAWGGPRIQVLSSDSQAIGTIPLNFVRTGGLNTWAYVISVIKELANETDGWIYSFAPGTQNLESHGG